MKPPKFSYLRAASLGEALEALARGDARILAGGQSLMPMLNFRLLRPSLLVDVNRVPGLDAIDEAPDGGLEVGALTRHRKLEASALVAARLPVLAHAVAHIGHLAIRNRGTLGGSLSHADPSAEHLLMSVLLDASLTIRSAKAQRTVRASDHIAGALATHLGEDEMLVGVRYPALPERAGWGFEEFARRAGDFALAAAGVVLERSGGRVANARVAVAGGVDGPVRVPQAEAALEGSGCDEGALDAAAEAVRRRIEPHRDLHASPELRHRIIGTLLRRACAAAWRRAEGEGA